MINDNEKETLKDNFPSNSRVKKIERANTNDAKADRTKMEKVIVGKAKKQKRSLSKRLVETFMEDDTKSVGGYIVHDVLIPAAKSLICDVVGWGGFAEMILFGGSGNSRRPGSPLYRDGNRSRVNYNASYRSLDRNNDRGNDRRDISRNARARHDFGEIILDTRGEAEEVLSHLVDLTIDYGQATVADLYDLVGMNPEFTDNKWGWTDLRSASVSRRRDGYALDLPRTQPLD